MNFSLHCFLLVFCLCQASAYFERFFENDNVCSTHLKSNVFNLIGHENRSAMIIKDSHNFQSLIGEEEFDCQFTVKTSHGLGIFVVIQRMNLRQNSEGQCIDYVQFRHTEEAIRVGDINIKLKQPEPWSSKMCGKINEHEIDVNYEKLSKSREDNNSNSKGVKNSFIDHLGLIEVKIHLSNKPVIEDDEEPSFEVVFTSFKECKYDMGLWKSCDFGTCIYKDFFQDGVHNCPYKSCKDESSCTVFSHNENGNPILGIKVIVGIVAALSVMIIAIIVLPWLFYYFGIHRFKGHRNSHKTPSASHLDQIFFMATAPPEADVKN